MEVFHCPKKMGSKIRASLIQTNIKTCCLRYEYKLVCVDDKFTQPYKSYLGEDAVYSFIDSMVEESKYCGDGMKKHFNREFPMTKKK